MYLLCMFVSHLNELKSIKIIQECSTKETSTVVCTMNACLGYQVSLQGFCRGVSHCTSLVISLIEYHFESQWRRKLQIKKKNIYLNRYLYIHSITWIYQSILPRYIKPRKIYTNQNSAPYTIFYVGFAL